MNESLTSELYWLVLTILMTALMWVPYILNRMKEQGIGTALWDPQGDTVARAAWANRMMCAHENAVENLVIFAPLVLAIYMTGSGNEVTGLACLVYFLARLAHYVVFTLGVPLLRVITFLTGFGAQVVLALVLLDVI